MEGGAPQVPVYAPRISSQKLAVPDTHGPLFPGGALPEPETLDALKDLRPLGQIHESFIVAAGRDGLWIIDQHVAHERILFEQVLAQRSRGNVETQGLLMPLILTPIIGPAAVVPVLGVAALFNNGSRMAAFRELIDFRRAAIVGFSALPTCALSAYFYTRLSGPGVSLVLGLMLVALVPARHALAKVEKRFSNPMLAACGVGYGALVGGTSGTGVLLIAILLAAGLQARAVIATDAATTFLIGIAKTVVFQGAGAMPLSSWIIDRKSTRLNSSHVALSRMPSSA